MTFAIARLATLPGMAWLATDMPAKQLPVAENTTVVLSVALATSACQSRRVSKGQ